MRIGGAGGSGAIVVGGGANTHWIPVHAEAGSDGIVVVIATARTVTSFFIL
jgi:hypothetical protein